MTAGMSGGSYGVLSFTVARSVRDSENGFAHLSELFTVVRDAADVGDPVRVDSRRRCAVVSWVLVGISHRGVLGG